jgi:hypothetical protein
VIPVSSLDLLDDRRSPQRAVLGGVSHGARWRTTSVRARARVAR